jgi:O-methyltransferase
MRHHNDHIYEFVDSVLELPPEVPGVLVEAGCYKGISSAKFSLVAKMTRRDLVIFDSFQGMPPNDEHHERSILGHSIEGWFEEGNLSGSLGEVKDNVRRNGHIEVCRFIEGWFDDTMPHFKEQIAALYLDVDLASSTRTCLKYLYPLVAPGGVVVSQDGDFPLVIDVLRDEDFWRSELGTDKPEIEGLGTRKMIKFHKRG